VVVAQPQLHVAYLVEGVLAARGPLEGHEGQSPPVVLDLLDGVPVGARLCALVRPHYCVQRQACEFTAVYALPDARLQTLHQLHRVIIKVSGA